MDSTGASVITWASSQDANGYRIYAQRYDGNGAPVGTEFLVSTDSGGSYPSVAMDSDGDFVITWNGSDLNTYERSIRAQCFERTGAPKGAEFAVATADIEQQVFPGVAMDSDGDFVITWALPDNDYLNSTIRAQRYNSSGDAQGSEFQVNTDTGDYQSYSCVAMDSDGNFVVAWLREDFDQSDIYARRYNSSGVAQGTEFQVNTYTEQYQDYPSVAMDRDGDFVVTWSSRDQDGDLGGIYAQRYNSSGTAVGSEFRVNTYTKLDQSYSSVAMDGAGNFVISWTSAGQDGSDNGIYAQRYNSNGVAAGSEFRVNTTKRNSQIFSHVAMKDTGNVLIGWNSFGQDGSGWGIYADRLSLNKSPIARNDTLSANEDSSAAVMAVLGNDTDLDGDTLTITGSTAPSKGTTQGTWNGTVSQSGPWNGLVYTPNADFFGVDAFSYSISDGNGGTATATVTVNVLAVNDAPSFTKGADQTVNEDAGLQTVTGWATALSKGPANEASQNLSFIVTTNNNALFAVRPSISPTGTLSYKPAANKHGSATVTVTLRDSGGSQRGGVPNSAPQTFTITVNSVNDAPVANAGADRNVTQTGVLTNVQLSGVNSSDPDGDTLTYEWKKGSTAIAMGATVTVALPPGSHTFTLKVTDPSGASDTDTVTVNVMPPATTIDKSVSGSGSIKVNTVACSFSFSVSGGSGTPSGSLSYVDPQNNRSVSATQITSVVVSGSNIRIFGKATINGSGSYDFIATARDNALVTPPRADTFGITLSDGYTAGLTALASGDIVIGSAP
jgi:hypothetical protein